MSPHGTRRRFLGTAALTMAAAQFGTFGADAEAREPRQYTAIGRATEWINSPRLTAASLIGKVVVVDFCTYTCINWLRTLPYVRAWVQKYTSGLVLIGVHTPEFAFEKGVDAAGDRRVPLTLPSAALVNSPVGSHFGSRHTPRRLGLATILDLLSQILGKPVNQMVDKYVVGTYIQPYG